MTSSRKCGVCRSRKVKCDEAKPKCGQCRIKGRPCTYDLQAVAPASSRIPAATADMYCPNVTAGFGLCLALKSSNRARTGTGVFHTFASEAPKKPVRAKPKERVVRSVQDVNSFSIHLAPSPRPCETLSSEDCQLSPAVNRHTEEQLGFLPSFDRLKSPSAYRQQLKSLILNIEFPPGMLMQYELKSIYNRWFVPRSIAMQTAIDCVLTLYLALTTGNSTLKIDVEKYHVLAVEQLQTELTLPEACQSDGILGTIETLAIASQFRAIASTGMYWLTHMEGLESVFKARGPVTLSSDFARDVLFNSMPVLLVKAIDTRRSCFLKEPEWQAAVEIHCHSPMARLALLTARIPTILEQVDGLSQSVDTSPSSRHVAHVLGAIVEVKDRLAEWLETWHFGSSDQGVNATNRSVILEERYPAFVRRYQQLSNVFPFAAPYDFDNALHAWQYAWYSLCQLACARALLDVLSISDSTQTFSSVFKRQGQLLERCNQPAEDLCRVVPYLYSIRDTVPYAGGAICTSVTYAGRWYEAIGDGPKANWCRSIRDELEDRDLNTALQGDLSCVKRIFAGWPMLISPA